MDETLAASRKADTIFGMQLFCAIYFHFGCGPSVKIDGILAEIHEATALGSKAMLLRNMSLTAMAYEDASELKRRPDKKTERLFKAVHEMMPSKNKIVTQRADRGSGWPRRENCRESVHVTRVPSASTAARP
jgi:hypothetical protein